MHPGQRADTLQLKQHVLDEIGRIWARHPDLRLGQLIANLFPEKNPGLYYIEDADLLHGLTYFYGEDDTVNPIPIPNDHPDCPCHLGKPQNPQSDAITITFAVPETGGTSHMTIYSQCPHHGHIIPRWLP